MLLGFGSHTCKTSNVGRAERHQFKAKEGRCEVPWRVQLGRLRDRWEREDRREWLVCLHLSSFYLALTPVSEQSTVPASASRCCCEIRREARARAASDVHVLPRSPWAERGSVSKKGCEEKPRVSKSVFVCVWETQSVSMNLFACVFGPCRMSAHLDKLESDLVQLETNRSLRHTVTHSILTFLIQMWKSYRDKQGSVYFLNKGRKKLIGFNLTNFVKLILFSPRLILLCVPHEFKWAFHLWIFLTCTKCTQCRTS